MNTTPPGISLLERLGLHRPELRAWAMYDWANSAFYTTVMAAVLPVYYQQVAGANLPDGLSVSYWGYTTSIALLIIAVISPVLGAAADFLGAKKRFLAFFMGVGVSATALLWFVGEGDWLFASVVFIVANIGVAGSLVFYESLLPHVAGPDEIDRVSLAGYAVGYIGGGVLLAINLAWILAPGAFGLADAGVGTRLSLLSVSVWWALFSIPLFRKVPEPPHTTRAEEQGQGWVGVGFRRVAGTLRDMKHFRQVFLFLLAFWCYNDGIGTIIKMATIFGADIGIGQNHLIGALLLVQFLGIPFTFAYGALAARIGTKRGIYLALLVYTGTCILGFFMQHAWQFWALAILVSTVQGGAQGLSRSLFASIVPRERSSEFFGLYSVSAKFAGIFGPLLFALVNQWSGESRLSIGSLVVFFVVGILLLSRVDVDEGRQTARMEDERLRAKG